MTVIEALIAAARAGFERGPIAVLEAPDLIDHIDTDEEEGAVYATVTTNREGRLTDSSVITIGALTGPVPTHAETGGVLSVHRIAQAARALGYRKTGPLERTESGLTFPVEHLTGATS